MQSDEASESRELLELLELLHLADSAFPIGAMAHSFGIESLVAECDLSVESLPGFFRDWLSGVGRLEAVFCLRGFHAWDTLTLAALNDELSALKPAEESRSASLRLGARFWALAGGLFPAEPSEPTKAPQDREEMHLSIAYGRIGARLFQRNEASAGRDARSVAASFLHQSLFGAISACQRLLPFGQVAATRLLWSLKPLVVTAVAQAAAAAALDDPAGEVWTSQPMLEIASMRHPHLETRLFIS